MGFIVQEEKQFRSLVENAKRPLVFFDDDGDGVTSFVMLYHALGCGKGIAVKKTPEVGEQYIRRVHEYLPDVIFILDKPRVDPAFFEAVDVPVVWLDHHEPQDVPEGVHYFNPRVRDDDDNRPTSYWIYVLVGLKADLWLATTGVISDWFVPDFIDQCKKEFPALLPKKWSRVEDLYVGTPVGKLILAILFMMKGTTTQTYQAIKALTRIEHPSEMLEQTSPRGKYLWKRYERYARPYSRLLAKGKKAANGNGWLVFIYGGDMSFTKELSNELLILYPKHIIVVGRASEGEIKASLRSAGPEIDQALKVALEGIRGSGGGHKHACGARIHEDDWEKFLEQFKKQLT